jgi:hypothetical protein
LPSLWPNWGRTMVFDRLEPSFPPLFIASHKDLKQRRSIKSVGLPSCPSELLPFDLLLVQGILYACF